MNTKRLLLSLLPVFALALPARAAQVVTVQTAAFRLDLRPSPRTVEAGASETLTHSGRWANPAQPAASVKIALDGADFAMLPGDGGTVTWTPDRGGLFTFTHTALNANGQPIGAAYEASFVVENAAFGSDDVTATPCEAVYDGTGHGISVNCAVANATVTYATTENGPFGANPLLFTNAVDNATAWYVVEAPFYQTITNQASVTIAKRPLTVAAEAKTKVYGTADPALTYTATGAVAGESPLSGNLTRETGEAVGTYAIGQGTLSANANYTISFTGAAFTITKATLPGDGEEPGPGTVPDGGLSKFDTTAMYDALGHTIDTNALAAAFGAAMGDGCAFTYHEDDNGAPGDAALASAPAYTNAGEYTLWYRVSNPNYEDFVHAAKVTITTRPATVQSADGQWTYDGQAHSNATVTVDGFVAGEGIVADHFATITDVGSVANAFEFSFANGTLADNYAVTCVTGTLTVAKATLPGDGEEPGSGTVPDGGLSKFDTTAMYDGQPHTIDTNALAAAFGAAMGGGCSFTYHEDDNGAPGAAALASAPAFTNAGEYTLWYRVSNPNYEDFVHAAKVTITTRPATVQSADGQWTYDGQAHSNATMTVDGFVAGEGIVADHFAMITDVGSVANAFEFSFASGTLADNYAVTCVTGMLTVAKATLPGDGEEPGTGTVPDGGLSKFDTTAVYDGQAHTIDTNALAAAFGAAMGGGCAFTYHEDDNGAPGDTALASAPAYTNAGEYILWYRVSNPNYEDFVHAAKVTITKRPVTVTVTGHTATFGYDTTEKTAMGYEATTTDGLYDIAADTAFQGTATAARTDVGTTAMGLTATQFTNQNANFQVTYTVTDGWVTVTKATLEPTDVFGWDGETQPVCEKTFNGEDQPVEISPNFDEPYTILWSLVEGDDSLYDETAPTLRDVADGSLTVYFVFVTENYEPLRGSVLFRILAKQITDEMFVLDDDVFFFDGTEKKPSVTVRDGEPSICTEDDFTLQYGTKTSAGLVPVTVTGQNNYMGTLTKEFAILKRPVASPVIGSKAYTGRTQRPTVPTDSRWTVVSNEGGIDVGDYPVVLRLTNTEDYRWKDGSEEDADCTFTFTIRKTSNGWSQLPGIADWTYGETPSVPMMGRPRYGTTSRVEYRRRGAEPETGTTTQPTLPGLYTARFIVDETANYYEWAIDVDFEILGEVPGNDHTLTTPEPVPYTWLDPYLAEFGNGDYEAAGNAMGRNGYHLWESYVAGLVPTNPTSRFIARIAMGPDGLPAVTWWPDLRNAELPRVYTVYGKASLGDKDWTPVTDENLPQMRFFQVRVGLP